MDVRLARSLRNRAALLVVALAVAFSFGGVFQSSQALAEKRVEVTSGPACQILFDAMTAVDNAWLDATRNGDKDGAAKLGKLSLLIQGIMIDFDCHVSEAGEAV